MSTEALGQGRQQLSISAGPHYGSCGVARRALATVELADNVPGGVARKVAGVPRVHIALEQSSAQSYCTGAPNAKLRQLGDFDGDGRADALLRHADGRWHYYPMGGRGAQSWAGVAANLPSDLTISVAGVGDFNGDGRDDALMRLASGAWRYYPMDGPRTAAGSGGVALPTDLAWQLEGVGDFNADGKDDVLLRRRGARAARLGDAPLQMVDEWRYYPMDGRTVLEGGTPAGLEHNFGDWVAGVGDFNGDGRDGVLFRLSDGGWHYLRFHGGSGGTTGVLSGAGAVALPEDMAWATAAIADFDGDGRDDVLLRHEDGRWRYQPMNGRRLLGGGDVTNLPADGEVWLAGVGDMNGDGRAEVLTRRGHGAWRHYHLDPASGSFTLGGNVALADDSAWGVLKGGAVNPPRVRVRLKDHLLAIEGNAATLDLSRHFSDDQTLTFNAESTSADVLRASVAGQRLTLAPVAAGRATVTVTGQDADGYIVRQAFEVIVGAALPDRPLAIGWDATLDLSVYFSDDRTLTFEAESSDADVVSVSVTGGLLTLSPLQAGRATITWTARDADGNTVAAHWFEVAVGADGEVGLLPPRAAAPVPDQPLAIGSDATLDLSRHFSDDQTLTFEVASSDADVVRVSVTGNVLTLAPVAEGRATVTVTARDADGYLARQTFQAFVSEDGQVGRRFRDCPECPEMVVVPAGSFMMGSPDEEEGGPRSDQRHERPQHRVEFAAPFAIGVFEVTLEQWDACVADGGCRDDLDPIFEGPNLPVEGASWNDAQAYVEWLSAKTGQTYRLPSDAEWEYAARAGTTTPFHFGEAITTDQANYDGEGFYLYEGDEPSSYAVANPGILRDAPVPVGSLPANPWGLHEVHGNVGEWTQDCFDGVGYAGWPADGSAVESGDCDRRYQRNGSFVDDPGDLRSARRQVKGTDFGYFSGFRVAKTLED